MKGYWTCQRQAGGVKCRAENQNRFQKCRACGKRRPPRQRAAHLSALEMPMAYYEQINGGPDCGICGKPPGPGERFHRDHEHAGVGFPRGVLCFRCNAALRPYMTLEWLENAVRYMRLVEERRAA